jgi:ferric-dicitrate binding protein FerR (iron transport regulator)
MSRTPSSIPPELRERLDEVPARERTELEAVWRLIGVAAPRYGRAAPSSDETSDEMSGEASSGMSSGGPAAPEEAQPVAASQDSVPDVDAAWREVARRTSTTSADRASIEPPDRDGREPRTSRSKRPSQRPVGWTVGVALALLLAVAAGVWGSRTVTVTAPTAAQLTTTLPDGSTVELNSGTTLRYTRNFGAWPWAEADHRRVRLQGEAFFTVAHEDRPFTVETYDARVDVLGTQFNVRSRSEDGASTEVVLADGRVRLSSAAADSASVVLDRPGAAARIGAAESRSGQTAITSTTVDVDRVLAWRRNGFAATGQSLTSVAAEIERRYDVEIDVAPSALQRERTVSLYYSTTTSAETILHDLCLATGLAYRPTSRGFVVYDDA